MKKYSIWLDQDEVIANLSKQVIKEHNIDFNEDFDYKDNTSYWWKDTGKNQEYFEDVLNRNNVFVDAEPIKDSIQYINKLIEEGFDVRIVTKPHYSSETCIQQKIRWIKTHLPNINIEKQVYFCGDKSQLAAPNRILIDDNIDNLKGWKQSGGMAIAYSHGWNRDWNGKRVHNHKELYHLIHKLNYNTRGDLSEWKNLK